MKATLVLLFVFLFVLFVSSIVLFVTCIAMIAPTIPSLHEIHDLAIFCIVLSTLISSAFICVIKIQD